MIKRNKFKPKFKNVKNNNNKRNKTKTNKSIMKYNNLI